MESKKGQPDKGKNRDNDPPNEPESASLASRIASSASGLARDLVGSASGNELQGQLASASGLSSKLANGSSSSSQTVWTNGPASRPGQQSSHGVSANSHALSNDENFRSTFNQHMHEQEFNDFLNGTGAIGTYGHEYQQQLDSWTGDFQAQPDTRIFLAESQTISENRTSNGSQNPGYDDGAEVRLLLSDPSFQPAWEEAEVMTADPVEDPAMDLFGDTYSPEEQKAADRMKDALPPPPVHGQVSPSNPLNLKPNYDSVIDHMQSELDSTEVSNVDGLDTPRRQQLASEWENVLNSYTDEVWGDMLPSVKAAISQLEEVKTGSGRLDSTAVTRLKMILGHVVQTADPSLLNLQHQEHASGAVTGMAQLETAMNQNKFMGKGASVNAVDRHTHVREDIPMKQPGKEEDLSEVTFHCPWISCHEASSPTPQ
jgi:hypothetical protein